jgi:hypothetical protein
MDLVLPLLLYNSARKPRWPRRAAHIAGSILAIVVGVSPYSPARMSGPAHACPCLQRMEEQQTIT